MKKLSILGVLVGVAVLIFFVYQSSTPNTEEAIESMEAVGTVTEVNLEQMAFDGPALVFAESEAGEAFVVAIPSMGLGLCVARQAINLPHNIQPGDTIQVRGAVGSGDTITPCSGSDHYLRIIDRN